MACFLGIDDGGTLVKAVLFDLDGSALASASRRLPLLVPEPGFCERDMDQLWELNVEVIRECLQRSGIDPGSIQGVACTGHGKGLYLWGKDQRPVGNGIVSTDGRAWAYPQRWAQDGTAARVFQRSCQSILACQPVALLAWLRDRRPELLPRVQWIFACKDYIRFRLTGQARAEVTDYSGSNFMNLAERGFDRELLAEFGLAELFPALPELAGSTELCGAVTAEAAARTGLRAGTPVAGGMFDIDACAVAMDVTDERNLCVIAGTWGINEYLSRRPVLDGSVLMNSLFCLPEYYLVEESSPTSAGNFEWFIDAFLGQEKAEAAAAGRQVYDLINERAAQVPPDGQNIVFLPYLFGSNYDPTAKACLVGLESGHGRAEIVRAVFEGIAFTHRVHVDKLLAARDRPEAVRLAGGAAKSAVWCQIFADVLDLPVEVVEAEELGTLGCAMAAAVATGAYPDLAAAARRMVRIRRRIQPDPRAAAIYRRKYALYRQVADALAPLWRGYGKTE
jgi:L-xylulokinase